MKGLMCHLSGIVLVLLVMGSVRGVGEGYAFPYRPIQRLYWPVQSSSYTSSIPRSASLPARVAARYPSVSGFSRARAYSVGAQFHGLSSGEPQFLRQPASSFRSRSRTPSFSSSVATADLGSALSQVWQPGGSLSESALARLQLGLEGGGLSLAPAPFQRRRAGSDFEPGSLDEGLQHISLDDPRLFGPVKEGPDASWGEIELDLERQEIARGVEWQKIYQEPEQAPEPSMAAVPMQKPWYRKRPRWPKRTKQPKRNPLLERTLQY